MCQCHRSNLVCTVERPEPLPINQWYNLTFKRPEVIITRHCHQHRIRPNSLCIQTGQTLHYWLFTDNFTFYPDIPENNNGLVQIQIRTSPLYKLSSLKVKQVKTVFMPLGKEVIIRYLPSSTWQHSSAVKTSQKAKQVYILLHNCLSGRLPDSGILVPDVHKHQLFQNMILEPQSLQ